MTANTATIQKNTTKLAILGGDAVASQPLSAPAWPPVNEATAQQLADLYLSRNWSFNGPQEQQFAADYAAYHGAKHGIFMANGTVTLLCALEAVGIKPGDEVIVPGLTWIATAMAVRYLGAIPVFVDIEPTTLCLDPALFEAAITERTRAVIPVHIYGGMADVDAFLEIAARHGIAVIEDCAHGQGGKWNGRGVGSWGAVGSFSFQQSKTMASGEGGICLTNDDELADRIYRAKHIGYSAGTVQGKAASGPDEGLICHNFRGTEFQALILRDQLAGLEQLIATYNENATRLENRLADVEGVRVQARGRLAGPQSYYAWCAIFDEGPIADVPLPRILEALSAEGLPIGGTYGPVYSHLLFNLPPHEYKMAEGGCPVSEGIGTKRTAVMGHAWLGSSAEQIDIIGDIIAKVVEGAGELRE